MALLSVPLAVLLGGTGARAAGTGGIEVTPVPGVVDGKQVTAFRAELPESGTTQVRFALRNITKEPRSARVYAASARADGQGGFAIGDAGSSPHVRLEDRTVRLAANETRAETFDVLAPGDDRPDGTVHAAVVIEVKQGAVVQRAATLVYLEPGDSPPRSRWVAWVAGAVLAAVILGWLLVRRRRRHRAEPA